MAELAISMAECQEPGSGSDDESSSTVPWDQRATWLQADCIWLCPRPAEVILWANKVSL